ncbi:MAG: TonB-dependent receptor [Pseudomonadota bacterium]
MAMNYPMRISGLTALATVLATGAPAFAQDAEPEEARQDVIVVTGEKQERSLQDTLASVDVTTAQDIEALNIVDLEDALRRVGNAGFVTTGSGRNEQFTLRGVQSQGVTGGSNTPVSTLYIDGAVVPNQAAGAAISNAWDVQQIEVLRGAQSTIQGRNSLIGAIVVNTKDPTDEFDWAARATYASENTYEISGAIGGPIVEDQLAFRLAGQITESDGFIERLDGSDGDAEETTVLRGKLRFTPTALPALQIDLTGIYSDETDGLALVDATDLDARLQTTDVETETDRELNLFSANISYEINDVFDLVSLTTYSRLETDEVADSDGAPALPVPITARREDQREQEDFQQEFRLLFDSGRISGLIGGLYAERSSDDNTQVQQSSPVLPVDFRALGLDGFYEQVTTAVIDGVLAQSGPLPLPPGTGPTPLTAVPGNAPTLTTDERIFGPFLPIDSDFVFQPEFTTTALFGELAFDATDRLTLIGGFRYEREEADYRASQINLLLEANDRSIVGLADPNPALVASINAELLAAYQAQGLVGAVPGLAEGIAGGATGPIVDVYTQLSQAVLGLLAGENFLVPIDLDESQEFEVFLPKFAATYDLSDTVSISASAQQAYRPGGIGINPVRGEVYIFDEETSWNYEIALRTQSADGRLTFNVNAFLIDWSDQQLEVDLSLIPQDTEVVNAGESELSGLEATLDYEVNDNWDIFASIGLLSTEITGDDRSEVVADPTLSLEGNEFPFAPEFTGTLGTTFDSGTGFSATVDVNFIGESEPLLPNGQGFGANDSRTLVNARLGYDINPNANVFVFGSNVFDETYLANAAAAGGSVVVGEPQVFGVGLSLKR